jgi:hypothetical protein
MILIDLLIGFWQSLKSFLIAAAASLRHSSAPSERQPPQGATQAKTNNRERKGDPALLGNKEWVSPQTAERYLGIAERQRQKLVKDHVLEARGKRENQKISTESILRYLLPKNSRTEANLPEKPNRSEPERTQ